MISMYSIPAHLVGRSNTHIHVHRAWLSRPERTKFRMIYYMKFEHLSIAYKNTEYNRHRT